MIAALACAAAVVATSTLTGVGLARVGGCMRWRGWMPALGLAALFALTVVAVRLPGHGAAAAAAAVLASGLGGWFGRRALIGLPWREAAPVVVVLLALTSVPFLVDGRFGPLGQSVNSDLAFHMLWADWLGAGRSFDASGYPLGPHALVAALARLPGVGTAQAFAGLLMAVPALTGVCALGFVRDLSPRLRVLTAVLAGLPYLAVSYYVQGSHKEPQLALFFLAAVSALQTATRRSVAVVLSVLGAGAIACFNVPSLAWLAVAALAALVVRRRVRPGRRTVVGLVAFALVAAVAAITTGFFEEGPGRYLFGAGEGPGGNFRGELNPIEVLGVWPSPDFRDARTGVVWWGGLAIAGVAGVVGLWGWRRREDPLPAVALLASLVLAAAAAAVTIPYLSAKALVVAAPLLMVVVVGGLLSRSPRSMRAAAGWALGCGVFVALAAHSSLLALRGAAVGPPAAGAELESMGRVARGQPTLFLGQDLYAPWYLREVRLSTLPRVAPVPQVYPRPAKRTGPEGGAADFDSPPDFALARFRYVVTPRTAYASRPPSAFRLVRRGKRYLLFRRTAPLVPRRVLNEGAAPGATLDCSFGSPPTGTASVVARPVVSPASRWRQLDGGPFGMNGAEAVVPPTVLARLSVRLPPGRWRIAMAYRARFDMAARLNGRKLVLPAFLGDRFAPLELGEVRGGRTMVVEVRAAYRGRGVADRPSYLGAVSAVRMGDRPRSLSLRRACGRYVDFFHPPPAR